jgi:predicted dehydrogenase
VTPSPPLRLGVLGCGKVFQKFHLPAIQRVPAVSLVAAHDIDPLRTTALSLHHPELRVFRSTAALLGSGAVDAILVLTPPVHHAEAVVQGLDAGLHVLVEKPMALEPADARRMKQAAAAAGRKLQVGFSRRFREPYQQLKKMLSAAPAPAIYSGSFQLSFPSGAWSSNSAFLGKEEFGGGVFHDVLCHQVDLVCWYLGRPEAVRALPQDSKSGGATAELRFPGAVVKCEARHGPYAEHLEFELTDRTVLEATGSSSGRRGGSQGWRRRRALIADRLALLVDRIRRRRSVSLVSFERQLQDFERSIRGGDSAGASADDGLVAVEIVHACRLSATDGGSWMRITETVASIG